MKYSQTIGIIACLCLIAVCFMPWSVIVSKNIIVSGISAKGTNFGSPGLMNIFFSILLIVFFLIKKIWAKRINIIIGVLNIAWAFRNYLLVSTCDGGECQVIKIGFYLLLIFSLLILIMTFLPKISLPDKK